MVDRELYPPKERTCERCGRRDRWDEAADHWTIVEEDGDRQAGDPYCIHEWNITAAYNPFEA